MTNGNGNMGYFKDKKPNIHYIKDAQKKGFSGDI